MAQIRCKFVHRLIATVRTFFTTFQHDLFHTVGKVRNGFPGRRAGILDMLEGDRHGRLSVIRHLSCHHFIQRDTQRIDIALFIAEPSPRLFGGSIVDRAHYIGGDRVAGGGLRDSEVRHLDLAFLGNNNVLGLDVSVDDMSPVRSRQAHGDLDRDSYCLTGG